MAQDYDYYNEDDDDGMQGLYVEGLQDRLWDEERWSI